MQRPGVPYEAAMSVCLGVCVMIITVMLLHTMAMVMMIMIMEIMAHINSYQLADYHCNYGRHAPPREPPWACLARLCEK